VTKVFLDTSPVVYYVEAVPAFAEVAKGIFAIPKFSMIVKSGKMAKCHEKPIIQI
jgi:hypothetical protein